MLQKILAILKKMLLNQNQKKQQNSILKQIPSIGIEDDLFLILSELEKIVSFPIKIIDSARTFKEHVDLYKKMYKDKWEEFIPYDSRHLPSYNKKIRAVDFKCSSYTGKELATICKDIAIKNNIMVGIGTGLMSIHLDVDRDHMASWEYDY